MALIDMSRHKRFFAFGCSMTAYRWPTWADILSQESPESYNYGKSGGGNLFISCSLTETVNRYKIGKGDLVIIMWSSICREDRYYNNDWNTPGNIFTQGLYDEAWVQKFADPKGYLLRDMALIDLTRRYLESTEATWYFLNMSPFEQLICAENKHMGNYRDIMKLYQDTLKYVKPDILNTVYQGRWPETPILAPGGQTFDYHPTPAGHLRYLERIFPNLKLKESTKEFVNHHEELVRKSKTVEQVEKHWFSKSPPRF